MNDLSITVKTGAGNSFIDPLLRRWREQPSAQFGAIREAGKWREVSWAQFMERASQVTAVLQEAGVAPGDIVPIILRHDLDAHAAFIGVMLAGAVPSYLPYPNVKHDHVLYWFQHKILFEHVQPRTILVYDELTDAMRSCVDGLNVSIISQSAINAARFARNLHLAGDSAIALLQHSSGTTGLKKGVALSYGAITLQLEAYGAALGLDRVQRPVVVSWLPLYHDMGLISSFLMPLWRGIPIVTIDPFEWIARPASMLEAIERYRATHAWLPNFAFLHLSRMAPSAASFNLSSLEALVNCSEPCKPVAFDAFLKRFSSQGVRPEMLQTCYAMAETVFAVSQSEMGRPPRRLAVERSCLESFGSVREPHSSDESVLLLSNGIPLPGCKAGVERDGRVVGEREVGEIVVGANYMFSGYFNNEEASRNAFSQARFRTGDIGFLDGGELFVVGRIKDIIIVNGKNVFVHDVEAALLGVPGLKAGRAVVFGHYSDRVGSEQIVVVAEREGGAGPTSTEILKEVNRRVVEAVGVSCADVRLVAQGWLVKTTSGKLSRSTNAHKYAVEFRQS